MSARVGFGSGVMAPSVSNRKEDGPSTSDEFDLEKTAEEAKSLIEKVIKDVGKKSATRQLIFGSASGWYVKHCNWYALCSFHFVSRVTGFVMMKLGKAAAFTLGSGIIALQLANSSGYVKINWDKLTRGVERVAEQVEDSTADKKKSLLKKVTYNVHDHWSLAFIQIPMFVIIIIKSRILRTIFCSKIRTLSIHLNYLLGQRHCREQLHYGCWIYGWFFPWYRLLINVFPTRATSQNSFFSIQTILIALVKLLITILIM